MRSSILLRGVTRFGLPGVAQYQPTNFQIACRPFSAAATAEKKEKVPYKRRESHDVDLEEEYKEEIADIWKEYDERKKRKQSKIGVVVSTKAAKSITVEIRNLKYFPKYRALVPRHKKIMAHDEEERANEGDIVRIVPCRPRSRKKRHELIDIIRRPKTAEAIDLPTQETPVKREIIDEIAAAAAAV